MNTAREHQWEWVRDMEYLDPYWAKSEFELRRRAVEIQKSLAQRASGPREMHLALPYTFPAVSHSLGNVAPSVAADFRTAHFEVLDLGPDDEKELLLIEECLRRAYAGLGW